MDILMAKNFWQSGFLRGHLQKLAWFILLFFACPPAVSAMEQLYCKMQGTNSKGMSTWDLLIKYSLDRENNRYVAEFPKRKPPVTTKLIGNELSLSSVINKRVQQGFYREIFDAFRLDLQSLKLTHSYLYYVSKHDFDMNFKSFEIYNDPDLFRMIDLQTRPDYVKLAWDKSQWQCEKIPLWKWVIMSFFLVFINMGVTT